MFALILHCDVTLAVSGTAVCILLFYRVSFLCLVQHCCVSSSVGRVSCSSRFSSVIEYHCLVYGFGCEVGGCVQSCPALFFVSPLWLTLYRTDWTVTVLALCRYGCIYLQYVT